MEEIVDDRFGEGQNLQALQDEILLGIETSPTLSSSLRSLYRSIVEEVVGSLEHTEGLTFSATEEIHKKLHLLRIEGMEGQIDNLAHRVEQLQQEKFAFLEDKEQHEFLRNLKDPQKRDAFVRQSATGKKREIAQHIEEQVDGPVADFYDNVGLGGVVRYLNEKGKTA